MRKLIRILLCLMTVPASVTAAAATYQADLDTWLSRELTPYVADQLTTQPRFRNEPIRFVVFAGENPQSASSKLALDIRDRLRDAMARNAGLRIVWQRDAGNTADSRKIDCTKDQAHYYIGVEVVEERGGLIGVEVRALDLEDQNWVAGFSRSWQGYPDAVQRRQLREQATDQSFRGMRDAPFDETQIDLLAAYLANNLGCSLLRQTAGEYVVSEPPDDAADAAESAMLELVSNNLADFRAVQFSATLTDANAVIEGKAHQVDDDLYQYWVTVKAKEASSDLPALSANAYIRIREKYQTAALIPAITVPMARSDDSFLGALSIVEMRDSRSCANGATGYSDTRILRSGYAVAVTDCYALEVAAKRDAVLFFLNHQLSAGLVRLSGPSCAHRADARIARSDEALHFPLPIDSLMSDTWTVADTWELNPGKDSYYVVAVADTKASRAMSQHIGKLPNRCSASVRRGLDGLELRRWLDEFAVIAEHFRQAIDWRVIRVRNMY